MGKDVLGGDTNDLGLASLGNRPKLEALTVSAKRPASDQDTGVFLNTRRYGFVHGNWLFFGAHKDMGGRLVHFNNSWLSMFNA